jgi:hypothetical protein
MSSTPEEIEAEIAAQREQLAETVDELAARLDVKTRAGAKVAEIKDRATTEEGKPRPEVLAAAGAVLALAVAAIAWRFRQGGNH